MRRLHFEALQPRCPLCLGRGVDSGLTLGRVEREIDAHIIEGGILCPTCLREYPILDGVPILVADLRTYIAQSVIQVLARRDLSASMESLIGDCCGPGSAFEVTRYHLSTYAWGHYADLDPEDPETQCAVEGVIAPAWSMMGEVSGPALDVGCAVGRGTFALAARVDGLVLGVDLNFSLIQQAARILQGGRIDYPRRRVGLVYDRRSFPVELPGAERVDFWACDAQVLPFAPQSFGAALSLNVLDCMGAPTEHLRAMGRVLRRSGRALMATPYDWSPSATPVEAWIGGHSQRGASQGSSEILLRDLLSGTHPAGSMGLRLVNEISSVPWPVRVHARSTNLYQTHVMIVEGAGDPGA